MVGKTPTEVEVEVLIDTLSDALSEVVAKIIGDTLTCVQAEAPAKHKLTLLQEWRHSCRDTERSGS